LNKRKKEEHMYSADNTLIRNMIIKIDNRYINSSFPLLYFFFSGKKNFQFCIISRGT